MALFYIDSITSVLFLLILDAKPDSKMEAMLVWAPHPNPVNDSKSE